MYSSSLQNSSPQTTKEVLFAPLWNLPHLCTENENFQISLPEEKSITLIKNRPQKTAVGLLLFNLSCGGDECVVNCYDCCIRILLIDKYADLYLTGGDHTDVDVCAVKSLEHLGCNTTVAFHACADD